MHELFSDWYRAADPAATRETITKRWGATDELATALTRTQVGPLARFVMRPGVQVPAFLQASYKTHDETMATRNVEEELRILAAAVLRLAAERSGGHPDVAACACLSLLAGSFGVKEQPPWLLEHLRQAAAALSDIARLHRHYAGPPKIPDAVTAASIEHALSVERRRVEVCEEMNNLLWWALTQHSPSLDSPYAVLGPATSAVATAFDLFALARSTPIPAEAETLMLHVLGQVQADQRGESSFKNYITGLGRDRAALLVRPLDSVCFALCPLMANIRFLSEGRAWPNDFDSTFGFRSTQRFKAEAIAFQMLRELTLAQTYSRQEP